MPYNKNTRPIHQAAFLQFVFNGQKPPTAGRRLTFREEQVFKLTKQGLNPREVSEVGGFTTSNAYDCLAKIRAKGWPV